MFFHKDLDSYTNKNFRSYEFIKYVWSLLEHDFLYALGMINTGNITIAIDPDSIYMAFTSNYRHVLDSKYSIDFNHSLCLCEDFSIEVDLQITDNKKNFYIDIEKCKLYFQKNNDEGIVEFSAASSLNIDNYLEFKNKLFLNLVKEIQFAINRNIFSIDINGRDYIIAEIDADFEIVRTYSLLYGTTYEEAIYKLIKNNTIYNQNKYFLIELVGLII